MRVNWLLSYAMLTVLSQCTMRTVPGYHSPAASRCAKIRSPCMQW
jgi:hypothetical protein